ncbi:hypothetical protein SCHPADRAFT_936913 [Schizopora paradoxa]|uniref:Uncharacterized protein n=1 Tax=Schizopora paradoxa TaxID=27342 RepID=A0A0H2S0M7_9AGAM|nr:hypothetical protein SCHPADRAFT_936913 [Schizopora paradoxa]
MSPIRSSSAARSASRRASAGSSKLSQEDDVVSRKNAAFDDENSDSTSEGFSGDQLDLDDVYEFSPKSGDFVWVKAKTDTETWYKGLVMKGTKEGPVRQGKQGTFYLVRYRHNLRRYFAPLLGDIKPDTAEIRQLLNNAGIASDIAHN